MNKAPPYIQSQGGAALTRFVLQPTIVGDEEDFFARLAEGGRLGTGNVQHGRGFAAARDCIDLDIEALGNGIDDRLLFRGRGMQGHANQCPRQY